MTKYVWRGLALSLFGSLGMSAGVEAQDAALEVQSSSANEADVGETEKKDPMQWIGIGLKLGVAGNGEGELDTSVGTTTVSSRTGFNLSLPINMGGDGFGWIIEPYLNMASIEGVDSTGAAKDYGVTTFGMYSGPTINFHAMDPLYVGFGFGPKIGYSSSDAFDFGADVMFRVPVTATYYLINDVGLVGELGLGYGLTGLASLPTINPMTLEEEEGTLEFGSALTWDVSVGARWP